MVLIGQLVVLSAVVTVVWSSAVIGIDLGSLYYKVNVCIIV